MPLPDADKKSPRVYTLLQNLDLENLSADNLADVGDPIAIEEANEDELRRLCLVAFARMVTKGSFDGWLSGGGGLVGVLPLTGTTDADQYDVSSCPPWNGATITTQSISGVKIGIQVIGAEAGDSLYVAIYSQDTNFLPSTLLGYATISLAVTGEIYEDSISATVSLTAGTQYWYSVSTNTSSSATIRALHLNDPPSLGITTALVSKKYSIEDTTRDNYAVPPSTFTPATTNGDEPRYVIGLKY